METKKTTESFSGGTMNMGRFCGLLQSDGNIGCVFGRDRTLNPRIILTHSGKDSDWIDEIVAWLRSLGITCQVQGSYDPSITTSQRGLNITIERKQCRNLIDLILKAEEDNQTPLLFDSKAKDFLLLQESIKIQEGKRNKPDVERQIGFAKLVDISVELKRTKSGAGLGPRNLTRSDLATRLGCDNLETKDVAATIISEVNQKVEQRGNETLQKLYLNPKDINPALAEFISGIFDGDGSFSISLQTHGSLSSKETVKKRKPFEIVPNLNLTDTKRSDYVPNSYLFEIISAAFGKTDTGYIQEQGRNQGGERLVIRDQKALREFAVPLFEKHPPSLKKNVIRFKVFRHVLNSLPEVQNSKEKVIELVKYIYETDLYERDKSLEEFLGFVEDHFKS